MKGPLFYSKILLFGEYGIIKDSKGLAIPYNFYNGALKIEDNPSQEAITSNKKLVDFAAHLASLNTDSETAISFDIERLNQDIAGGMYFDSSIPQGYGVRKPNQRKAFKTKGHLWSDGIFLSWEVFWPRPA